MRSGRQAQSPEPIQATVEVDVEDIGTCLPMLAGSGGADPKKTAI